jgi:hypothetical protein
MKLTVFSTADFSLKLGIIICNALLCFQIQAGGIPAETLLVYNQDKSIYGDIYPAQVCIPHSHKT